MNSSISNSNALTQSTKQAIHQQDFRSVYIPTDIWREIAEFSSADTVQNLRQVYKDIRSALDDWSTVEQDDAYVRVPEAPNPNVSNETLHPLMSNISLPSFLELSLPEDQGEHHA